MTIITLERLCNIIANSEDAERRRLEAILIAAARAGGAIYYSEVGPTGNWNVFGDCYDYADAHRNQTVEI